MKYTYNKLDWVIKINSKSFFIAMQRKKLFDGK